jgi:oligoribonuclease (3'-5' exoribonuclease)
MNKPWLTFLDIETTGLEMRDDIILAVGIVVVDHNLDELASMEHVIGYPRETIETFRAEADENVKVMHTNNGLWDASTKSNMSLIGALKSLEETMRLVGAVGTHMAGHSVWFDRAFLEGTAPGWCRRNFHYRVVDVSVFKVLGEAGWLHYQEHGVIAHMPLDDIRASIQALKHVREDLST